MFFLKIENISPSDEAGSKDKAWNWAQIGSEVRGTAVSSSVHWGRGKDQSYWGIIIFILQCNNWKCNPFKQCFLSFMTMNPFESCIFKTLA